MSYSLRSTTSTAFQLTALSLALVLAGCGGGGTDTVAPEPDTGVQQPGTGTPGTGTPGNTTTNASEIFISSEKPQLFTGIDKTIVNIRVTDANGGIVKNVPVSINIADAALYGLSLNSTSNQTTDDQGLITVELIQGEVGIDSQLNHETLLTVTANGKNGVIKQALPIIVSGTRTLNVVSSKNVVEAGDNFRVSGQLVNGTEKAITNASIVLYSNDKEVGVGKTDNNGNFVFDLSTANLVESNEGYLFSLEVKGVKVTQRIPDILKVASSNSSTMSFSQTTDIVVGDKQKITLNVPDANNGDIVYVSTNKGKILTSISDTQASSRRALTVVNKKVEFFVDSNVPGTATIRAEHSNAAKETTLSFVSIMPTKLLLQIERSVLNVSGSTSVVARVLDKDDAPVKNAIVQFTTTKDSSGGSLGQSVVFTDDSGRAKVTYTAGQNPTSTNGVIIEAQVQSIKLPNGQEKAVNTLTSSSNITVQTKSSYISFAFADKVSVDDSDIYYFQKGSVSVLNSSGKPAINQPVSINLTPNSYLKGEFIITRERFEDDDLVLGWYRVWKQKSVTCASEDKNNNSILDVGEDFNGNGMLDPINVTAILNKNGQEVDSNQNFNFVTDATGRVDFSIRYPKQYANWYKAQVSVNTRVDGSESQQSRVIDFPTLVDDVSLPINSNPTRPNWQSPFGTDLNCSSPN